MSALLLVSATLMTICLPIPATFLNLVLFLFSKKYKIYYGVLLSLSLAVIAYVWNPGPNMDLSRWHLEVHNLSHSSTSQALGTLRLWSEPLKNLMVVIVSRGDNYNWLQFFPVLFSYVGMTWMLADYKNRHDINPRSFVITAIFVLLSARYVYIVSGLWSYLATIIFALGFYLHTQLKTKRVHWLLYIASFFIHTSMLLPLLVLLISCLKKGRATLRSAIVVFVAFLFIGTVIYWLHTTFSLSIIDEIYRKYNSYFVNGENFDFLHGGMNLVMAIIDILASSVFVLLRAQRNDKESAMAYNFKIFSIVSLLAVLFHATVFIRHALFIAIIAAPDMMDFFNGAKLMRKKEVAPLLLVCLFVTMSSYSQCRHIQSSGIAESAEQHLTNNIFQPRSE